MKVIPEKHYNISDEGYPRKNITIYLMKVIPEKHYNIPDEGYPRKTLQYT
jgi:hypothetical protein